MARKTTTTRKSTPRKASSTRKESPIAVKRQKPVFRVGTFITVLLLAVLIGFAFYLNREKEIADAEATSTGEEIAFVLDVLSSNIKSIEVKPADGDAVKIIRNAENVWDLALPIETEADQGMAEAAASQISALPITREIDDDPATFGLDKPVYVFTVELVDGKIHTLEVGDITPTNSGYYVRLDKAKMMIVSLSGIDSLLNLVNFPPYLNTPTPTALPPTETPVPPTEAPTLQTTVTPTP